MTAHAGGDEDHVDALQGGKDLVHGLFGGGAADLRLGAGAQALGDVPADLHRVLAERQVERLGVGVGDRSPGSCC
jgi:hypothetical protein